MSDIDNLQHLSGQLRQGAQQFSDAAQTLRQQAQQLDWSAQDLASGVNAWAGQGSQNFTTAWNNYHQSTQKAATALDNTSQSLTKLAQKIDDKVQQMQEQQSAQTGIAIGLGVLTVGLVILDVLQLGLDPVTDAATVAAGSADAAAVTGAEAAAGAAESAADALVEVDTEIASELDDIAVDDVSDSGDMLGDTGTTPNDINIDSDPLDSGPPPDDGVPPDDTTGNGGDNGDNGGDNNGNDNNGGDGSPGSGGQPEEFAQNSIDSLRPQNISHIFENRPEHMWDLTGLDQDGNIGLIKQVISDNYENIINATRPGQYNSVFGDFVVSVRGTIVNGIFRISTAFVNPV